MTLVKVIQTEMLHFTFQVDTWLIVELLIRFQLKLHLFYCNNNCKKFVTLPICNNMVCDNNNSLAIATK